MATAVAVVRQYNSNSGGGGLEGNLDDVVHHQLGGDDGDDVRHPRLDSDGEARQTVLLVDLANNLPYPSPVFYSYKWR